MLQRFIAVTLITIVTGMLTACGDAIQSNQSIQSQPSSATENTFQLKFPSPPSAEMKNELKRAKYQSKQDDQDAVKE